MGLGDLTSSQAVLDAVAEYDRIGRDPFLAKYGFGPARRYVLVLDDRHYDSKAIVGAAHGYQFPDHGPLTAQEFSGGEATVRRRLAALGFEVQETHLQSDAASDAVRNPPWSRDELILALDFYMQHRPAIPSQTSAETGALSDLLNWLAAARQGRRGTTFRNANGVYMKLMNFRRFDPDVIAAGGRGLQRGSKGDEEVWNRFRADPEGLRLVAQTIRSAVEAGEVPEAAPADLEDGITEATEGAVVTHLHQRRERNRDLVKACKSLALRRHGHLRCEACDFSFGEHYGELGRSYIECHHTKPVHTLQPNEVTRIEDLALICANCHRMIHTRRPWLTMEELVQLLQRRRCAGR